MAHEAAIEGLQEEERIGLTANSKISGTQLTKVSCDDHRLLSRLISHTAVVENNRLGHALALVKAQQDVKRETKVRTNSEKLGYQKQGRQLYGPDYKAKIVAPPAVEMV